MDLETQAVKLYQNESGNNGSLSYNVVSSISGRQIGRPLDRDLCRVESV